MGRKSTAASAANPPSDTPLGRLVDLPAPLGADDDLPTVSAALRTCGLPALPVIVEAKLIGCVSERELLGALAQANGQDLVCRQLVRPLTPIPATATTTEAAWLLQRDEVGLLAVIDADGRYLGLLSRARLTQHLEDQRRPRLVGGLATPVGVHLTTQHHRGGAGDVALVLSGVQFGLMVILGRLLYAWIVALFAADPGRAALGELSIGLGAVGAVPFAGDGTAALLGQLLLVLTLVRLTPLAGYHGAEHQSVHALERGLPLTPEVVARMPRPHPRCGTNLVVLLSLLLMIWNIAGRSSGEQWWLLPLLVGLLFHRKIGWFCQQHFTTRPASRRQIEAGIAAAKLLLSRYRGAPEHRARWPRRVWHLGLLQVAGGMTLTYWAAGRLLGLVGWLAMKT